MKKNLFFLISLIFITLAAYSADEIIQSDKVKVGRAGSSADKTIVLDTNSGANNPSITTTPANNDVRIKTNNLKVGTGAAADQTIQFNTGSGTPPAIKWNNTSGKVEFTNNGTSYQSIGSGGGGTFNLIDDGDAESGITNFVTGSYTAATRPSGTFTASSGSGTFAISTSSSSPLFGSNSFLLTKSSGASRQGRAIERTIVLDAGYRTKMLKTRIDYTIVSGTFVAGSNTTDSSLIWYVGQFNGTTWTYTEPSTFKMFSNSITNSDWVEGEFQVNSDTTQLKLIGFISESANSAWVVKAEVGFRLSTFLAGTTISDWTSFNPTGSWVSNTTYTGMWRRVADTLELKYRLSLTGAPTAASLTLNLPSGLNIDSAKALTLVNEQNKVGFAKFNDQGVNQYDGDVSISSATALSVFTKRTLTGANPVFIDHPAVNATSPFTWGSTDTLWAEASGIPIQGWASSTQQSDGYDGRQIGARYYNSASSISGSASTITFTTREQDDTNSYSGGTYTAPSPGWYRISAGLQLLYTSAADVNNSIAIFVDGSERTRTQSNTQRTTSNDYLKVDDTIYLRAGQLVTIRASSSGSSPSINSDNARNFFSIVKSQAPTTISATELVASIHGTTSQTITAGGTRFIVDASTKLLDTHGLVTTGASWKFTAQYPGLYEVKYVSSHASVTLTTGASLNAELYKNGSFYKPVAIYAHQAATATSPTISGSVNVWLNSGEYIDVRESVGGSVNAVINDATIYITKIK